MVRAQYTRHAEGASMIKIGSRVWDSQGRAWVVKGVTVSRRVPVAYVVEVEHGCRPPKRLPAREVYASLGDLLQRLNRG